MAHAYAHLYQLPCTGLRFFTVYVPWGRPDMALFIFTKSILESRPIDIYNHGRMRRDFTYVDDIVEGIARVAERIPQPNPEGSGELLGPGSSSTSYRIYNIGNHHPVELKEFIAILEDKLGKKAKRNLIPVQPGDVPATFANVADLESDIGFKPKTSLREGIGRFVDWYLEYHGSNVRLDKWASTLNPWEETANEVTAGYQASTPADSQIGAMS